MISATNKTRLTSSLAFKQARLAVFVGLLLGLSFSALQILFDLRREVASIDATYARTLAAFEDTGYQAAFGLDLKLAERVVDGLLLQPAVIEATLIDSYGDVMSRKTMPLSQTRFPSLVEVTFGQSRHFEADLSGNDRPQATATGSDFVAGRLAIVVDTNALASAFLQRSALVLGFGLLRNLVLAVILTYLFYRLVTRPLRRMARAIDAGAETLSPPARNRSDELGALAQAYNQQTQSRVFTERQLMAEEQKHRALFETSDISQWILDFTPVENLRQSLEAEGLDNIEAFLEQNPQRITDLMNAIRVSSVNAATLTLFKAAPGSTYLQTLSGIFAEDGPTVMQELMLAIWDARPAFRREMVLHTQDNNVFRAIVSLPLPPPGARLGDVTLSIVDISMLSAPKEAASLPAEVLNALEDAVCTVRLSDTSILMVNPALERLFQHSAGKLVGQPLLLLAVKTLADEQTAARHLSNVIQAEKGWHGSVDCQRRDGTHFTSHVRVSSHFHDQHGALAILSFRTSG